MVGINHKLHILSTRSRRRKHGATGVLETNDQDCLLMIAFCCFTPLQKEVYEIIY